MRNLLIIVFICFSASLFAQKNKPLTSPEVKNKKIWNLLKTNTIITIGNPEKFKLRSKDFKNYKPWKRKQFGEKVIVTRKKQKQVYGGKAKNKKTQNF